MQNSMKAIEVVVNYSGKKTVKTTVGAVRIYLAKLCKSHRVNSFWRKSLKMKTNEVVVIKNDKKTV